MHRYCRDLPANDCYVDPVARYMHFEKHYHAGDLDPAFPVLTAFELFHAVDSDATDDDMTWLRSTVASFRPDFIAMSYHWRYAESVHSESVTTSPVTSLSLAASSPPPSPSFAPSLPPPLSIYLSL